MDIKHLLHNVNTDGFPFPMRANNTHLLEYTVTFD